MRPLIRAVTSLQRSQLSVQGLSRLSSVCVFLLASWTDQRHLALVALQGVLFAIPYTLMEALIGRPLSADLVPVRWNVEQWARRATLPVIPAVGVLGYVSAAVAMPETGVADRLLMVAPVLLQLPLEAVFWAAAKGRRREWANLVPQLTSVGTLLASVLFAAADIRMDLAAAPAQLAVLCWVWLRRSPVTPEQVRPTVRQSVRLGSAYCVAAGIDLSYSVALPSIAGRIVGPEAIVVLRAMELAFGPFHVALSASTREDVVGGRRSRILTGTRLFTVVLLLGVSVAVVGSTWVRHLLAAQLASVGTAAVAVYCGYKAVVMFSTWLSIRHMIWAPPRRYLVSAVGSRVLAFAGMAVSLIWIRHLTPLFAQLLIAEAAVVVWYAIRMRSTNPPQAGAQPAAVDDVPGSALASP